MPKFSQETIQKVLDANDIVDVISQYTTLKRTGRGYMGSCPFHSDSNPSFSVSREKQVYNCFSCHRSGNLFGFIMEEENLSFPEAVRFLAERAGIEIEESSYDSEAERKAYEKKNQLFEINKLSANLFYKNLMRHPEALKYLKDRGLTQRSIRELGIGLAPAGWHNLLNTLRKKGYPDERIIESGLVIENQNHRKYDRFRNRIMFPIQNGQDKLIGFGARKWTEEDQGPKYLNSPETPVFEKGEQLYNLNRARKHVSDTGRLLLVEGYMDVAAMVERDIPYAVAALGTAFTPNHARLLAHYAPTIVIAFDGDTAGENATFKALTVLEKTKAKLKIVRLPKEHDPDSFIKEKGRDAFLAEMDRAISPLEFRLMALKNQFNLTVPSQIVDYLGEATKIIAKNPDKNAWEMAARSLAEETGISYETILDGIKAGKPPEISMPESSKPETPGKIPRRFHQAQTSLVRVFLDEPGRLAGTGLTPENFSPGFFQWIIEKLTPLTGQNEPVSISQLFDSEDDMRYNKKTSVIMNLSFDAMMELYPASLSVLRQKSLDQRIEKLKQQRALAQDAAEKDRLADEITQLLKEKKLN